VGLKTVATASLVKYRNYGELNELYRSVSAELYVTEYSLCGFEIIVLIYVSVTEK